MPLSEAALAEECCHKEAETPKALVELSGSSDKADNLEEMSSLRDEAALDDSEEKSLVSLVKLVAEAETMGSKEAELADCDLSQTHFAVFQTTVLDGL